MADRWVLQVIDKDGRVDVLRSGRRLQSNLSMAEAKRYLRAHRHPGDIVLAEDLDGYRHRLSGPSRRRRKR